MSTIINTIFRLKRGTAQRWEELNPILQQGEPGFVYDANLLKIGDGITPWNDLPYIVKPNYEYDDTFLRQMIQEEESRAKRVEKELDLRLAGIEDFFAAIETPDTVIDTLSEIVHYINEDKEKTTSITNTLEAITNSETGILTMANNYTDNRIAEIKKIASQDQIGLVKIDEYSIKMNESKQIYVDRISTDNLEQGSMTLVLNAGTAIE